MIADAGEIGSAVANKLSATKGVPRANIQRGAGFGEAVRKKLRLCMAARFVSFWAGWVDRAIGFYFKIYRTLLIAAVDRYFLLIFVGILTVTNI